MKQLALYKKFLIIIIPLFLIMVLLSVARFEFKAEIESDLVGIVYDEAYLYLVNEGVVI